MCSLWQKWLVVTSLSCARCGLLVTYIKYFQFKKNYNPFKKFCCHQYNSILRFNKEKAHRLEKCPLTANKLGLNAYDLINSLNFIKFHSSFASTACMPEKHAGSLPNNKWIRNIPRLGSCHHWSGSSQICNRNVCKLLEEKCSARANPFKQSPILTGPIAEPPSSLGQEEGEKKRTFSCPGKEIAGLVNKPVLFLHGKYSLFSSNIVLRTAIFVKIFLWICL